MFWVGSNERDDIGAIMLLTALINDLSVGGFGVIAVGTDRDCRL